MTVKASYAYVEEMRVASMWSEAVKTGVEAGIMEEDLRGDVCVCCVCVCGMQEACCAEFSRRLHRGDELSRW